MTGVVRLNKQQLVDWLLSAGIRIPTNPTVAVLQPLVKAHAKYLRSQGYIVDYSRLPSSYERRSVAEPDEAGAGNETLGPTDDHANAVPIPSPSGENVSTNVPVDVIPSSTIPTISVPTLSTAVSATETIPTITTASVAVPLTALNVETNAASTSWAAIMDAEAAIEPVSRPRASTAQPGTSTDTNSEICEMQARISDVGSERDYDIRSDARRIRAPPVANDYDFRPTCDVHAHLWSSKMTTTMQKWNVKCSDWNGARNC